MRCEEVAGCLHLVDCMEIRAGVSEACLALAAFIHRPKITAELVVFDVDLSVLCKQASKAGSSSRKYAIEHVNPQQHAQNQINRITHSHQVSRFVLGQPVTTKLDDLHKV